MFQRNKGYQSVCVCVRAHVFVFKVFGEQINVIMLYYSYYFCYCSGGKI